MTERKCDYSPIVEKVGEGRVPCPDVFFKAFKSKGRCFNCNKARTLAMPKPESYYLNEEQKRLERAVRDISRGQNY